MRLVERVDAAMDAALVNRIVGCVILIKAERAGNRAGHLADFERMGQPVAIVAPLVLQEHLGLMLQAPKGGGMHNAVAVALEFGAGRAGASAIEAAARLLGIGSVGCSIVHLR